MSFLRVNTSISPGNIYKASTDPLHQHKTHSAHVTQHIAIKALRAAHSLHASWQEAGFLLPPICPVWSRLALNCCERSHRSTGGWVGCHKESELHPSPVPVCVCAYVEVPHVCACVFFPLNIAVNRSFAFTSVSFASLPARKEPPDTCSTQAAWAHTEQQRCHITRVYLVLMPELSVTTSDTAEDVVFLSRPACKLISDNMRWTTISSVTLPNKSQNLTWSQ